MQYKIEIWQYGEVVATYTSPYLENILKWYKKNWQRCYDGGGCSFDLWRNNDQMTFEEINLIGFFGHDKEE